MEGGTPSASPHAPGASARDAPGASWPHFPDLVAFRWGPHKMYNHIIYIYIYITYMTPI